MRKRAPRPPPAVTGGGLTIDPIPPENRGRILIRCAHPGALENTWGFAFVAPAPHAGAALVATTGCERNFDRPIPAARAEWSYIRGVSGHLAGAPIALSAAEGVFARGQRAGVEIAAARLEGGLWLLNSDIDASPVGDELVRAAVRASSAAWAARGVYAACRGGGAGDLPRVSPAGIDSARGADAAAWAAVIGYFQGEMAPEQARAAVQAALDRARDCAAREIARIPALLRPGIDPAPLQVALRARAGI